MKQMMKSVLDKIWFIVWILMLVLQVVVSIVMVIQLIALNMVPGGYLWAAGILLLLLAAGAGGLIFLPSRKKTNDAKRRLRNRRIAGSVLSVVVILTGLFAGNVLGRVNGTLNAISGNKEITDVIGVYVLASNPASSITDAKDYKFAVCSGYDYENSTKAISAIEKDCSLTLDVQEYETVDEIVDALYAGEAGAIILNEAYVGLLEEQESYFTFSTDTKVIYEYRIVQEVQQEPNGEDADSRPITERPFIVYISGSDTRDKKLITSHSDVNILVVVNPQTKQVLLINTPRDYYIETSVSKGAKDKLTHCGLYGMDCSMETLSVLYDEDIDYYAQINFNGFEKMIDAIGGIEVTSPKSFTTTHGNYYIKEGENTLNGNQALCFVRERYAFADGDFQRGRNQMMVIQAIIGKMSASTLIMNYADVLDSMEGMFITNVSSEEMGEMVKMQLSDGASWTVNSFTSIGTVSSAETYSMPGKKASVILPDYDAVAYAKELINRVVAGETLTAEDMVMP